MPKRQTLKRNVRAVNEQLSVKHPPYGQEARQLAMTAHALAVEVGDRLLEAEALLNFGKLRSVSSAPLEMLSAARRAEQIFRAHGRSDKVGTCLVMMARALYDLGEESNALTVLHASAQTAPLSRADLAHAAILKSMCLAQLGNTGVAVTMITAEAIPLARDSGQPFFVMLAKSALCLLHLRVLLAKYTPPLWTGLPGIPTPVEPAATPALLLALLRDAESELQEGERWDYLTAMRHVVHALAEPQGTLGAAVDALRALVVDCRESDPTTSAWVMFFEVNVLLHHAQWISAQAVATEALAVADTLQMPFLTRELLRLHVWACENTGNLPQALASQKRVLDLWLKSVLKTVSIAGSECAGPPEPVTVAALSQPPHLLRNLQPTHVRRAIRFIDETGGTDCSVPDVVRHCGVSRRTLEVGFKASMHLTIAAYIRHRRMESAATLLLHSDHQIRQVAAMVGYSSAAAFTREFSTHYGMPPSDWQREQRGLASPIP